MKKCHHCKEEIPADLFVGRQAQCPCCGTDLHSCLNCAFHEQNAYNDCRERQAERVLDKNRSNFCDYFRFQMAVDHSKAAACDPKIKLEDLFKQ